MLALDVMLTNYDANHCMTRKLGTEMCRSADAPRPTSGHHERRDEQTRLKARPDGDLEQGLSSTPDRSEPSGGSYPGDLGCLSMQTAALGLWEVVKGVIRVSMEVRSGAARFRAVVWAENIVRALSLVRGRYPGCEARVLFPIEPESFFVAPGGAPWVEEVVPEVPEVAAG
jgi:hypothetical protein